MLVGLVLGGLAAQVLLRSVDRAVLAAVSARALRTGEAPRLENLVEGLCVSGGIVPPTLHAIDDAGLNVLTVGRSPGESHLVVTTGLIEALTRIELEAVVARELALIKSGHVALATSLVLPGRVVPSIVASALPPRCDVVADMEAVAATRFPPGMVGALERAAGGASVSAAPRWTRHLWIVDPDAGPDGGDTPTHSPIDERIATLREL